MLAFMDPIIHGFTSAGTERTVIAGAFYNVVHEHAQGICTLFESKDGLRVWRYGESRLNSQ